MITQQPIRLRTLGPVSLTRSESTEIVAVLSQPKRLALLVYLAVANRGAFCRRDTVLGVFWPEFDQERARAALRKALHFLRHELGNDVIVGRGDEEIGIDPQQLACDANEFRGAVDNSQWQKALSLYVADFLEGLHSSSGVEFERWLETKQQELRRAALQCATTLAERHKDSGKWGEAEPWARRATELAPYDENAARRLIEILDRTGQSAAALDAYAHLAAKLEDIDLQPSTSLRERIGNVGQLDSGSGTTTLSNKIQGAGMPQPGQADTPVPRRHALSVAIIATLIAVGAFTLVARRSDRGGRTPALLRVLTLPLDNLSGDESLTRVGQIAADWLSSGITDIPGLTPVPFGEVQWLVEQQERGSTSPVGWREALATASEASFVVTGAFHRRGDSLVFQLEIVDISAGVTVAGPAPVGGTDWMATIDTLKFGLMGALATYGDLELRARAKRPPPIQAYEAYLLATEAWLRFKFLEVERRAREAIAIDPHFMPVYDVLIGGALFNLAKWESLDSLAHAMGSVIDPSDPAGVHLRRAAAATANGDIVELLRARRGVAAELGLATAHFRHGFTAMQANRPSEAAEAFARIDPRGAFAAQWAPYWGAYAWALHTAGDYAGELEVAQRAGSVGWAEAVSLYPRALAGLGRVGDATEAASLLPPYWRWVTATELRAHGHDDAADPIFRALAKELGDQRLSETERDRVAYVDALIVTGKLGRARRLLEDYLGDQSEPAPEDGTQFGRTGTDHQMLARLGVILAMQDDSAGARRVSAILKSRALHNRPGLHTLGRARIAAALGDRSETVHLLNEAFSSGATFHHSARHLSHADVYFEDLRGFAPYDEFIRSKHDFASSSSSARTWFVALATALVVIGLTRIGSGARRWSRRFTSIRLVP